VNAQRRGVLEFCANKKNQTKIYFNMNKTIAIFSALALAFTVNFGQAQTYKINTSESTLEWEGGKITGSTHTGLIQLTDGYFQLTDGAFTLGSFTINMASMTNTDLGGEYGDKLMGHLKSDDFFSVATYPEATLEILSSTRFVDGRATVQANATIKGHTERISFDVVKNGDAFDAEIVLDRSKFDVRYGSDSFFDNLGDNVILDNFTMRVHLVTK
jgi:polyisoprenoid-binding protein YceI